MKLFMSSLLMAMCFFWKESLGIFYSFSISVCDLVATLVFYGSTFATDVMPGRQFIYSMAYWILQWGKHWAFVINFGCCPSLLVMFPF